MTRIGGDTEIIAHVGFPTHAFRSPAIYNPWFEANGIDAVVVPTSCRAEHYAAFLPAVLALTNVRGALVTMPHKASTVDLLDRASPAVRVANACNAVRRGADGKLEGEQFDGEGFVRAARARGVTLEGARALVVGCGGAGSAIAASLAGAGVRALSLFDARAASATALGTRLRAHRPALEVSTGDADPAGFDVVVNATPMGMADGDPMPVDVTRISPDAFVGEIVMARRMTAFLSAVEARGCEYLVGTDMLFEMVPAYLEWFGFPAATPARLRELARLDDRLRTHPVPGIGAAP